MHSSYFKLICSTVATVIALYFGKPFLIPLALWVFFGVLFYHTWHLLVKQTSRIKKNYTVFISVMLFVGTCLWVWLLVWESAVYLNTQWAQLLETLQLNAIEPWKYINALSFLWSFSISDITWSIQNALDYWTVNSVVGSTISLLLQWVLVVVYAILIIIYYRSIEQWIRNYTWSTWKTFLTIVAETIYAYTKGMFLVAIIVWLLYYLGLKIMNVEYAYLIASWAALLTLVPTIWTFIWWVLASIASWILTGSVTTGLLILWWFFVVQVIDEYFIVPHVVWKKVELNPLFTIIAVVGRWLLRWIAGVFLGIPISAVGLKMYENTTKH